MADESISSLRAAAHPLRLRMLSLLTGTAMSAAEVARELDISHANASYHLRVLLDAGEVVVEAEERIRGGVAKRYRHPWRESRAFTKATPAQERQEIRATAQELVRRHESRNKDTPMSLCDAELWVPAEVWGEAQALVRRAAELVHEAARPPRTEGALHVNLTAVSFQMTEEAAR
jgi:DNA-binding transcriptional ArsR family regulator